MSSLKFFSQSLTEPIDAVDESVLVPIPSGEWRWIEVTAKNNVRPRVFIEADVRQTTDDRIINYIGRAIQPAGNMTVSLKSSEFFRVAENSRVKVKCGGTQDLDTLFYAISGAYKPLNGDES